MTLSSLEYLLMSHLSLLFALAYSSLSPRSEEKKKAYKMQLFPMETYGFHVPRAMLYGIRLRDSVYTCGGRREFMNVSFCEFIFKIFSLKFSSFGEHYSC